MKYIIDIPNDDVGRWIRGTPYGMKLLIPISIEDGKEYHIKTDISVQNYSELYQEDIENEVWEFARRIICPSDCCEDSISAHTKEIFSKEGWEIRGIFKDLSYQEAKAKYNEWLKQKDEIKVGDEIVGIYSDGEKSPPLVVLRVEGNYYYGIYSKTGELVQGGLNYEKTGRHFSEVIQLMEKMKEDT